MAELRLHALAQALALELPCKAFVYARRNAPYYTQFVTEEAFAAAVCAKFTHVPPERLLAASARVDAPLTLTALSKAMGRLGHMP
jgi:hypothetical protein